LARDHEAKQRTAATFNLAEAQYDALECALDAMGLQLKLLADLTAADHKWLDAHGGRDKIFETL
jgi:hypothetical protein